MQLTPDKVILLGLLAALLAQILKLVAASFKIKVTRVHVTVFLFVVSLVVAYIWAGAAVPVFPALPDDPGAASALVIGWIGQLVAVASTIIGFAIAIYNVLLQKVFEAAGIGDSQVKALMTPPPAAAADPVIPQADAEAPPVRRATKKAPK